MFSYPSKERKLEWIQKFVTTNFATSDEAGTELSEQNPTAQESVSQNPAGQNEGESRCFPVQSESLNQQEAAGNQVNICPVLPEEGHSSVRNETAGGESEPHGQNTTMRTVGGGAEENTVGGDGKTSACGLSKVALADGDPHRLRDNSDNDLDEWFDMVDAGKLPLSEPTDEPMMANCNDAENVILEESIDGTGGVNELYSTTHSGGDNVVEADREKNTEGKSVTGKQDEQSVASGKSADGRSRKMKRSGGEGGRWEAQHGGGWQGERVRYSAGNGGEENGQSSNGSGDATVRGGIRKRSRIPVYIGNRNRAAVGSALRGRATAAGVAVQQGSLEDDDEVHPAAAERGPVVIDMSAHERVNSKPSEYMMDYHGWMYRLGVTSYQLIKKQEQTSGHLIHFWNVVHFLQKMLCAVILTTSAMKSLCQAKFSYLDFISTDGQNRYNAFVKMSYNLSWFLTKMLADYIFVIAKEKVERMIHSMQNYEATWHTEAAVLGSKWKKWLVALTVAVTCMVALLRTTLTTYENGFKQLILDSSQELVEDVFIWSSANMENVSNSLQQDYTTELNWMTGIMGSFVMLRDVAGYLQVGMMFDLAIVVGIVLLIYTLSFLKEVKDITPNAPPDDIEACNRLQVRREAHWRKYRKIRSVFEDTNMVFDPLMKLFHLTNSLLYCFFMVKLIFTQSAWYILILYVFNLMKAEIGYLIDTKIAEVNEAIRDWIRNWAENSGKFKIGDVEMDAALVLDELDKKPLGLGKGKFVIHQNFHLKFLGLVLTVFFSMADEIKKAKEE